MTVSDRRGRRHFRNSKRKQKTVRSKKDKFHEPEELKRAPHTMVYGQDIGLRLRLLTKNIRQMMQPFTAAKLRASRRNTIDDFLSISGLFHVSHVWKITRRTSKPQLQIVTVPKGPTLTFDIERFTLCSEVISALKKPNTNSKMYTTSPLLILNGMRDGDEQLQNEPHIKMAAKVFQRSFPSINVQKINASELRRCILIDYNNKKKQFELRQFSIKRVCGHDCNRLSRKLMMNKAPDLSKFETFEEVLCEGGDVGSESDADGCLQMSHIVKDPDDEQKEFQLRLVELGPRISLRLHQIVEGVCDGNLLYPHFEVREAKRKKKRRRGLKREGRNDEAGRLNDDEE